MSGGNLLFYCEAALVSGLMENLLQPMVFERLDHVGHDFGYPKACGTTRSPSGSLLTTPDSIPVS